MKITTIKTPGFVMETNADPKYTENGGNMTQSGGTQTMAYLGKDLFKDAQGKLYQFKDGEFEQIN